MKRRRKLGAEIMGETGVSFRVFAPGHAQVEVVIETRGGEDISHRLAPDAETGYFCGLVPGIGDGVLYRFRLAGAEGLHPDPASRFQPAGPFGPSEVVDPSFLWTDGEFPGVEAAGQIIYELHAGTFTKEGTWAAASHRLAHLAQLGVTVIELMPVNEFAGRRGWGYDGVNLFAPYHHYGRPEELRRFVDDAHQLGIGVILDVVYNHFGPAGNFISKFAPHYQATAKTEWGEGLNYDGEGAAVTRELVKENAAHWIDEYHLDGLRIDATQAIVDSSPTHILQEIGVEARRACGRKSLLIVAENESQEANLARPIPAGGLGLDALWNDDFHHSATVALTGHREAYYTDYEGSARELIAAVRHGFLFQGQRYDWQRKSRGRSTRGLPPRAFVAFLENHDQLANYGAGHRLWTRGDPGNYRALTALLLLGPWTPMLFQGQEWFSSAPFTYFADHAAELGELIARGRADFLTQFPRFGSPEARNEFPDPGAAETFERCRLDWREPELSAHARALRLHRDLIALRRRDVTISRQGEGGVHIDGAAIGDERLVIRYFGAEPDGAEDRLLLLNLGTDYEPGSLSEPLSAPPDGRTWALRWSSEHPRYGGQGARGPREDRAIFFGGHTADLLIPRRPGDAEGVTS